MSEFTVDVTDDNFESIVINSDKPVLCEKPICVNAK